MRIEHLGGQSTDYTVRDLDLSAAALALLLGVLADTTDAEMVSVVSRPDGWTRLVLKEPPRPVLSKVLLTDEAAAYVPPLRRAVELYVVETEAQQAELRERLRTAPKRSSHKKRYARTLLDALFSQLDEPQGLTVEGLVELLAIYEGRADG